MCTKFNNKEFLAFQLGANIDVLQRFNGSNCHHLQVKWQCHVKSLYTLLTRYCEHTSSRLVRASVWWEELIINDCQRANVLSTHRHLGLYRSHHLLLLLWRWWQWPSLKNHRTSMFSPIWNPENSLTTSNTGKAIVQQCTNVTFCIRKHKIFTECVHYC